jgi:hypothetical protein
VYTLKYFIGYCEMATHFICQPTEPLAHRYPLKPGPGKGHGAVSQYELLKSATKPHTEFPPPGWNTSQSSEESLPLCQVPIPTWRITSDLIGPDPQLCITPEKPNSKDRPRKLIPESKPDNTEGCDPNICVSLPKSIAEMKIQGGEETDSFNGKKVKFDVIESENSAVSQEWCLMSRTNKSYKPCDYADSFAESEPRKVHSAKPMHYNLKSTNIKSVHVPLADHKLDHSSVTTKCLTAEADLPIVPLTKMNKMERIVSVLKIDNQKKHAKSIAKTENGIDDPSKHISDPTNKRKVCVTRETREKPVLSDYTYPFSEPTADSTQEYEHVFMRPEYNSTLRMRKEIESIKESSVDIVKALDKKLQVSEAITSDIREKVSVTFGHHVFMPPP